LAPPPSANALRRESSAERVATDSSSELIALAWAIAQAIGYLTKYLTGKHPPVFLYTSGPVLTVSRSLTRRTGVTMVALRKARRLWSAREGRCPMPYWSPAEFAAVAKVLHRRPASTRAP